MIKNGTVAARVPCTIDNPKINGPEDYDYTDEVIRRVKLSDNVNDVFITGVQQQ